MILRELPDLPPRPPTPANAEFRRRFYERWGRENAVILFRATNAEFPPYTQTLSIKRAWGGREDYLFASRRLSVGDERVLILNEGAHYGARIASPTPVVSLGVFFRPGMADEVAAAAALSASALLDRESDLTRRACSFAEHLRPLDNRLDEALTALRNAVCEGEDDEAWLEEQLQGLLWTMLEAEPGWLHRSQRLAGASRSAHTELLARIDRATDFIVSCHAMPLCLEEIAVQARLSKYHLVRVFRQVHGITPMAYLTQVRAATAARLISDTGLSIDEVADLSGFGCRQTLFRQLRRRCGVGARALRHRAVG